MTPPLPPQPLKHTIAPNDNAAAAGITGKPGIFRSRLRIGLMPAIGSSRNASAIGARDPPESLPLWAAWGLLVWIVMVNAVAPLPAGMVAGWKVTVELGGRPAALKATRSGRVDPGAGVSIMLYTAVAPGKTVALLELVVSVKLSGAATVKLVVEVAAGK